MFIKLQLLLLISVTFRKAFTVDRGIEANHELHMMPEQEKYFFPKPKHGARGFIPEFAIVAEPLRTSNSSHYFWCHGKSIVKKLLFKCCVELCRLIFLGFNT